MFSDFHYEGYVAYFTGMKEGATSFAEILTAQNHTPAERRSFRGGWYQAMGDSHNWEIEAARKRAELWKQTHADGNRG